VAITPPRVISRRNQPTTLGSRFASWTPFRMPSRPPSGSYDPALDSQQGAAQRGFADIQQDTEQAGQRANTDWTTDRTAATTQRGYGLEDFGTQRANTERSYGRSLADLLTSRARGTEDFAQGRTRATQDRDTTFGNISRGYSRLGAQQGEQVAARGVAQGGTLAAALAARTQNEGLDRQPVQQGFDRFMADNSRDEGRFLTDSRQGEARLNEDETNALGQIDRNQSRFLAGYDDPTTGLFAKLDTGYQRGVDDRAVDVARQGRELGFYNQDVGAARFFQAGQMGYVPPQRPSNEFVGAHGPYRVVMRGGKPVRVTPSGSPYR
jgi:hypothetical protein